jgi:hypothetical protein
MAQARIGETETQCTERYGKPVRALKDEALLAYVKSPMLLILHFTDGRCDEIRYIKAKEQTQDVREEISEDERDLLQKANGGNRPWKKSQMSNERIICFETNDGDLGSLYSIEERSLVIATREAYQRYNDRMKAKPGEILKGF